MSYQGFRRHVTLNAYLLQEGNLKRLYIIWFQLYNILEKANYEDSKKINGCQTWGWVELSGEKWKC